MPLCIRRVGDQLAVEVRCAIEPPDRTAFTEAALGGVDRIAGAALGLGVTGLFGDADLAPCLHELVDQCLALLRIETRVAHAPQAALDDEVAAIGRAGIRIGRGHGS